MKRLTDDQRDPQSPAPQADAGLIRDMPLDERPRERLLDHGAGTLSEAELLAVLLGTGRRGGSALTVARELLEGIGGLQRMSGCGFVELRGQGLGPAKAARILAALELATRMARSEALPRPMLERPAAAARYLSLRYSRPDQEVMGALFLDTRQRLLHERELFRGTLDRAAVEPRAILRQGLLVSAAGLLLFHTHPSGDPSPSAEDLAFTRRIDQAAAVVGIRLVDHLVVGRPGRFTSLRERGGW